MLPAAPRFVLWLTFVLAPLLIQAGDRIGAATNYAVKVWETDDGLPHNSISGVVQRPDGFLWIATQGGLVRFDGLEFKTVPSPLIQGVRSSSVTAIAEENAQTLVFGTLQSGLLRLRGGEVSVHPLTAQFDAHHKVAHLFREADDVFWVVFADREVWRWQQGQVEKFEAPPDLRTFWPASFARDQAGNVFLVRGAGVERYKAGALIPVERSPQTAVTIASSRTDGIWVATSRRLSKLNEGRFTSIAPAPWPGNVPPSVLYEDRHEALWLATVEQGLLRWKNGALSVVDVSHVKIVGLSEDAEGNLWVATGGGGLNRVQQTRLTLVAEEADWTDTVSGAVCEDLAGNIWFANRKAVRKIAGDRVEVVSDNPAWSKRALPICPDAAGNIWYGVGPELFRAKIDGSENPALIESRTVGSIHVIYLARDGSIWVGRNAGPLRRFTPDGASASFGSPEGFTGKNVRAMGEDAAGHLWVGTEDGKLFELVEGRFAEWAPPIRLPGHGIRAIHGDADGTLWIATSGGGLLVRHRAQLAQIAEPQGLPDDVISQILEDDFGWLWFGSRRGIFKVRKSDLLDYVLGRQTTITPISFGRADGISGISAVGSYQPTAWKTRQGLLWFVTRKGLVTTDPAQHASEQHMPRVYVERFTADGRPLDLARAKVVSSARKLDFQFTAPTFVAPERVLFRYQLRGFDPEWVEAGTRRFATYPSLRPGRYEFAVSASNGDLAWNPVAATLAFEVLPRWWETWWARLVAVGGTVFLLVALVRYLSHRRLKARLARLEQEQRVEQERVRIARDLHDDLGASLTHASLMADELAEDWPEIADPKSRSSELAERVRTIARDLDAVVWTVSPKHDRLSSLAAYLSHYAEEYFRDTSIECVARTSDDIPPAALSPEVRHHLFLIAKELLNNVLKHSHATRVELTMRMNDGAFELIVTDDGRGFSLAAAERSGRNGLHNLRARAEEAGGTLRWASGTEGTVATLWFPLPSNVLPRPRVTAAS